MFFGELENIFRLRNGSSHAITWERREKAV